MEFHGFESHFFTFIFSTRAQWIRNIFRHATTGMLQIICSFADVESECWRVSIITTQGTKHSKSRLLCKAGKQIHTYFPPTFDLFEIQIAGNG